MALFVVQGLTCMLESATKVLFLTNWLETQVTVKLQSLKVNYLFSTKIDTGSAQVVT